MVKIQQVAIAVTVFLCSLHSRFADGQNSSPVLYASRCFNSTISCNTSQVISILFAFQGYDPYCACLATVKTPINMTTCSPNVTALNNYIAGQKTSCGVLASLLSEPSSSQTSVTGTTMMTTTSSQFDTTTHTPTITTTSAMVTACSQLSSCLLVVNTTINVNESCSGQSSNYLAVQFNYIAVYYQCVPPTSTIQSTVMTTEELTSTPNTQACPDNQLVIGLVVGIGGAILIAVITLIFVVIATRRKSWCHKSEVVIQENEAGGRPAEYSYAVTPKLHSNNSGNSKPTSDTNGQPKPVSKSTGQSKPTPKSSGRSKAPAGDEIQYEDSEEIGTTAGRQISQNPGKNRDDISSNKILLYEDIEYVNSNAISSPAQRLANQDRRTSRTTAFPPMGNSANQKPKSKNKNDNHEESDNGSVAYAEVVMAKPESDSKFTYQVTDGNQDGGSAEPAYYNAVAARAASATGGPSTEEGNYDTAMAVNPALARR